MNPAVSLFCLRQDDRAIDDYVADFCGPCHVVDFNDVTLKGIFRHGLKESLYDLMPENTYSATLEEYIGHALFMSG